MFKQYQSVQQYSAADLLFDSSFKKTTTDERLDLAKEVSAPTGTGPSEGALVAPMPIAPMVSTTIGPFNSTLEQQYPDGIIGVTARARMSDGDLQGGDVSLDYRRGQIAYKLALQHSPATAYAPDSTQVEFRVEFGLGSSSREKSERKEREDRIAKKFEETSATLRVLADSLSAIPAVPSEEGRAAALLTAHMKFRSTASEILTTIERTEGRLSAKRREEVENLLLNSGIDELIALHLPPGTVPEDKYREYLSQMGGYGARVDLTSSRGRIAAMLDRLRA